MQYILLIHSAEEGGYWAEVAGLDGCFAQGETLEDVITEGQEAIASHLEALAADGQPAPMASSVLIATVSVPTPSPT